MIEIHGEYTYTGVLNITSLLKKFGLYDEAYQIIKGYYDELSCEQKDYLKETMGVDLK